MFLFSLIGMGAKNKLSFRNTPKPAIVSVLRWLSDQMYVSSYVGLLPIAHAAIVGLAVV